ncbi:MAG: rRNA maturation RNase YbeY [Acidaminococcaceae bacterium]
MVILLENDQEQIPISEDLEQLLTAGLNAVAKLHALRATTEVDITLVSDEEIHHLNLEYRQVDRATDVLSFALDEDDGQEPALVGEIEEHLLGDIIISAETAKRQAEEFGHGLNREIVYLAVHGLLHLLGYDHMQEEDKVVMRAKEEEALREIKLSEEFLSRS